MRVFLSACVYRHKNSGISAILTHPRTQILTHYSKSMATIRFLFEDKNIASKIVENVAAETSILELTEEHDVHLNHNCGGVCACSTCHIYVEAGDRFLEPISDKEEDFIDRAHNPRIESRLACQCIILDEAADITVTIPDQSGIIGHEH